MRDLKCVFFFPDFKQRVVHNESETETYVRLWCRSSQCSGWRIEQTHIVSLYLKILKTIQNMYLFRAAHKTKKMYDPWNLNRPYMFDNNLHQVQMPLYMYTKCWTCGGLFQTTLDLRLLYQRHQKSYFIPLIEKHYEISKFMYKTHELKNYDALSFNIHCFFTGQIKPQILK